MKHKTNLKTLALGTLLGVLVVSAPAQSSDALIDKLVDKGILTVKEANDLREEADKNFNQAYSVKTGMADWVKALKLSGDVRARYEGFYSDNPVVSGGKTNQFVNRNRYRYRVRFGATVSMFDNLEAGLRLTSGEPAKGDSGLGGDPISGNTTFGNDGSKKFAYIDLAYAKWYALNGPIASGSVTLGKMENPFVFDDMVFDPDYTPEGAAIQSAFRFNDQQAIKLNLGGFMLSELSASSSDPFLLGAQVRYDANWSKKLASSVGLSGLWINNSSILSNNAVPNQNVGNTRVGSTGALGYDFNPLVVDAGVTYTLDSFPLYKGAFPIKLGSEYMYNPAAPYHADNYGWNAGLTFGKAGKKGTWEFSYTYKWLGANSWYEELVDSDFGGLYYSAPTGGASGYGSGTNVKGHVLKLSYSPADALTLTAKCFLTDLINQPQAGAKGDITRLQIDATLKF